MEIPGFLLSMVTTGLTQYLHRYLSLNTNLILRLKDTNPLKFLRATNISEVRQVTTGQKLKKNTSSFPHSVLPEKARLSCTSKSQQLTKKGLMVHYGYKLSTLHNGKRIRALSQWPSMVRFWYRAFKSTQKIRVKPCTSFRLDIMKQSRKS